MEFILKAAEEYCKKYTSDLDELRRANETSTLKNHPHAVMHSGHVQGVLLEMLSMMIRPLKILEIGTFTGFSALCLSKGLQEGGHLHTIEIRKDDADTAWNYFIKAGISDRVILHVGDAKSIIPGLVEDWDLVFIDADKVSYIEYYKLTLPHVKKGGFIIADNVLFHGEVLEEKLSGKNAKAIQAFNEYVRSDKQVQQVLLTVRDGLSLIRKL